MKYDPTLKEQVARWGGRSKQNKFEVAIMEEKQNGVNPFEAEKTKKKLRVQKEKLKQIKNKTRQW